ncbi:MAG: M20 aminoacylase family protein [Steroidobacteraceae bacterium]
MGGSLDLDAIVAGLGELRRDLHAHPELGYEERRTAGVVATRLRAAGLEVVTGIGGTGVVGTLRRGSGSGAVGLRADMDALPIDEFGDVPHRSRHPGRMHACGHDGHTAMLVGAAEVLAGHGRFSGTIRFIFQPAEEQGAGARAMIDDGLLQRFPIDEAYALHNWPGLDVGELHVREGAMMAGADTFEIRITGRGGHAAFPHQTLDVIVAGSALVQALQALVARNVDPTQPAVVSVTKFDAGKTTNVLPEHATLAGTVRTFSPEVQDQLEGGMRRICEGIASGHGVAIALEYRRGYPPTVNSAGQVESCRRAARAVLGESRVRSDLPPSMGAEDFAFIAQKVPACYAWLGSGANAARLHAPNYDFNDAALRHGVCYWVQLAATVLPAGG